ncbi:uncharacterized protein LOC132192591 [Neocloeon triangulifer]|uniref:uncharacterized protein LOC132192591 n=1 Tax=Neocloeon triangulifer TaxID=2078957 RepID=UPI00286EB4FD|nr:uncharacterized protein LOC132192591 [Neocloeon triangulifer]
MRRRVILGLILVALKVADAGPLVQSRVRCGDHTCSDGQFCNFSFGNICSDCSTICDQNSHNYNQIECFEKCQAYILREQFASKLESDRLASSLKDLTGEVKKLQVLAWLSMAFSGVAAAVLICLGLCKLTRAKRHHGGLVPLIRTKFRSLKKTGKPEAKVGDPSTGLKLAISAPMDTTAPPTCSTTVSGLMNTSGGSPPTLSYKKRSPSEDNTLDYTYDNAGMSPSPTTFAKGVEFNSRGEIRF